MLNAETKQIIPTKDNAKSCTKIKINQDFVNMSFKFLSVKILFGARLKCFVPVIMLFKPLSEKRT